MDEDFIEVLTYLSPKDLSILFYLDFSRFNRVFYKGYEMSLAELNLLVEVFKQRGIIYRAGGMDLTSKIIIGTINDRQQKELEFSEHNEVRIATPHYLEVKTNIPKSTWYAWFSGARIPNQSSLEKIARQLHSADTAGIVQKIKDDIDYRVKFEKRKKILKEKYLKENT